ncbi:hypothetical protein [Hyalangium minutum]|uniref:Uncharacterized protein n=1 Tax=Hyalangium minutum TaxID=394096 RepID=A0A085WS99_9BACT|nr:hypothetical protein [Hyalangium minutum]KFE70562.1 hypothetical protein DB31_5604 [Hyalangium minutum]
MGRSRRAWWRAVAEAREWLTLDLSYADAPFEVIVAVPKDLERQQMLDSIEHARRVALRCLPHRETGP